MSERLSLCHTCGGQGLLTFETGPPVEPCRECRGSGRRYSDPSLRGLFAAILDEKGVLLDRELRLILLGLNALDDRVSRLEDERRGV